MKYVVSLKRILKKCQPYYLIIARLLCERSKHSISLAILKISRECLLKTFEKMFKPLFFDTFTTMRLWVTHVRNVNKDGGSPNSLRRLNCQVFCLNLKFRASFLKLVGLSLERKILRHIKPLNAVSSV